MDDDVQPLSGGRIRLLGGLIALAGAAAYAGSLRGAFVFDDPSSIAANPTIRRLWPPWAPFVPPRVGITVEGRPLLNFSLAINHALSGDRAWSYHALNLAIHVLAALTLFGIVRRTLNRPWVAFASALIWAVHPLVTESVTYVIQRAESLAGLFYLLTLYAFIRGRFRLSVLACLCGMATKEIVVTAPVMVFLYDRAFLSGSFREAWRRHRRVYAGLAATWILLAWLVIGGGGNRNGTIGFGVNASWGAYLLTQFPAVAHYLRLAVWPHPLVFDYGTFWVRHPAQVTPQACLVLGLLALTIVALARWPAWGFLGAWFFGLLAPTSLVPGTTEMIVEHRMYLPLAAVIIGAVAGGAALGARGRRRKAAAWLAAAIAFAGACAVLTARRNRDYRSDVALWADTVAKRPRNALARTMYAQALEAAGRLGDALRQFEISVGFDPLFPLSQENLGEVLFRLGRVPEAIARYQAALRLKPDFADACDNLGVALAREGRPAEAIVQIRRALAIKPDYAEAHYNLARLLGDAGRRTDAVAEYRAALRLRPDYPQAHYNLANTLVDAGRAEDALGEYAAALRLRPDDPDAEYNLGNALAALHRPSEAISHYRAALRLRPGSAAAENNWGSALFELGRLDEARSHYEAALRLDPDFSDAWNNLERLQANQRRSGKGS